MSEKASDSAAGAAKANATKANATPIMSTREMAHRINNTLAVVQSIINQTARMVSEPKEFARAQPIIDRLMAKEPAARYASANEAAAILELALEAMDAQ